MNFSKTILLLTLSLLLIGCDLIDFKSKNLKTTADSVIYSDNKLLFYRNDSLIIDINRASWNRTEGIFYSIDVDSFHNINYKIIDSNLNLISKTLSLSDFKKVCNDITPGSTYSWAFLDNEDNIYFQIYNDDYRESFDEDNSYLDTVKPAGLFYISIKDNSLHQIDFYKKGDPLEYTFQQALKIEKILVRVDADSLFTMNIHNGETKLLYVLDRQNNYLNLKLINNKLLLSTGDSLYLIKINNNLSNILFKCKIKFKISSWNNLYGSLAHLIYSNNYYFMSSETRKDIILNSFNSDNYNFKEIIEIKVRKNYKSIWLWNMNIDKDAKLHIYTFNMYKEDPERYPFDQSDGTINYHIIDLKTGKVIYNENEMKFPTRVRIF